MAKKFLIVIAAIAAVMGTLAIVSAATPRQELSLDYARESIVRNISGEYDITERHALAISDNGLAVYTRSDSRGQQMDSQRFTISSEEMRVLRELFLATGFMQIPDDSYPERAGLSNYTKYQLSVQSGGVQKSIRWVSPEAADGSVPSIVTNAGTRLDAIMNRYAS